jgi:tetratricopeptide (TPR) repeat protein
MKYPLTFSCFLIFIATFGQAKIDSLVKIGVKYHDEGRYDDAIRTYNEALLIDKNSPIVNYELSFTYFMKNDCEKSIEHADYAIQNGDEYLSMPAVITKGSCLDNLGKTEESIALFKNAIEKYKPNHLIYYNLGLDYYKISDYANAEDAFLKAIDLKDSHASSHLLLGYTMEKKQKKVQSLLPLFFFLILEPDTDRSKVAYEVLMKQFVGNVEKDKNKPNQINININSSSLGNEFSSAELMLSMMVATKSVKEIKGTADESFFVENTATFFKILGEMKKENNEGVWWAYYIPLFDKIARSEHHETFINYISQSSNPNAKKWLEENNDKLNRFAEWFQNQY